MKRTETIEDFIKIKCVKSLNQKVEAKLLYAAYLIYFEMDDKTEIGTRSFYDILKMSGYELKKSSKNKLYVFGLSLKSGD